MTSLLPTTSVRRASAVLRADRWLVVRFAVATMVAFIGIGLVASWMVEQQVREEHERFATFHAVFVRDSVLRPTLGDVDGMLAVARGPEVFMVVEERVLDDSVRRIRLWSDDGRILLSDDRSTIGRRFPEIVAELEGVEEPYSHVSDLSHPWMTEDVGLVDEAFVTLLPYGGDTVLEVVQDYGPTRAAIERFSGALSATRTGGLAVAFLLVLPIAMGASRRLRTQARDLEEQAEELTRLLEVEQETAERLREVDRLKNTFLTAVSHELRTPLTVVRGLASTLHERDALLDDARRRDLLARVDANAERLDELLRDLLDVDHLTRGVVTPQRVRTEIRPLVMRAVDHVARHEHRVMVDVPPLTADVDPAQLERIVENLVANAVRHTPAGCRVDVSVRLVDGGLVLVVEDDGPGIAAELRQVIFQPFAQGPIADAHSPGTGIGLSLVARFAELHGGYAWVEPSNAGGAAFHVVLQADVEVAPTAASGVGRDERTEVGPLDGDPSVARR